MYSMNKWKEVAGNLLHALEIVENKMWKMPLGDDRFVAEILNSDMNYVDDIRSSTRQYIILADNLKKAATAVASKSVPTDATWRALNDALAEFRSGLKPISTSFVIKLLQKLEETVKKKSQSMPT